jgi:chromosome segregation ATPase
MKLSEILIDLFNGLKIWGNKKVKTLSTGTDRIENLVDDDASKISRLRIEAARTKGGVEDLRQKLVVAERELAEADLGVQHADEQHLSPVELAQLTDLLTEREAYVAALKGQIADLEEGLEQAKVAIQKKESRIRQQRALLPALRVAERGAELKSGLAQVVGGPSSNANARRIAKEADAIQLAGHEATAVLKDAMHPDDPQELLARLTAGDRTMSALERSRARRQQALQGADRSTGPRLLASPHTTVPLLSSTSRETVEEHRN